MDNTENKKIVDSWLYDISAVMGIQLSLNDENICSFQIGKDVLVIEIAQDYPVVHIYSSLLEIPAGKNDTNIGLFTKALELNAFQMITRGGAIAIAPGGGFLMYSFSTPIFDVDSVKFSNILGAFFESLTQIKTILLGTSET